MTLITHKDPRYTLPALVYMAALGSGWIATATRARKPLTAGLLVVVAINLIGVLGGARQRAAHNAPRRAQEQPRARGAPPDAVLARQAGCAVALNTTVTFWP